MTGSRPELSVPPTESVSALPVPASVSVDASPDSVTVSSGLTVTRTENSGATQHGSLPVPFIRKRLGFAATSSARSRFGTVRQRCS